jgi:hypothetical protein
VRVHPALLAGQCQVLLVLDRGLGLLAVLLDLPVDLGEVVLGGLDDCGPVALAGRLALHREVELGLDGPARTLGERADPEDAALGDPALGDLDHEGALALVEVGVERQERQGARGERETSGTGAPAITPRQAVTWYWTRLSRNSGECPEVTGGPSSASLKR